MIGLNKPPDAWRAYQFDQAVSLLGRYVDNRMGEFNDHGEPKHTLTEVLADAVPRTPHQTAPASRKQYRSTRGLTDL